MTSLIRLTRGLALAPALVSFLALAPCAFAGPPVQLRIKNGHTLTVALGKTREAATGIRPEKMVWTLELDPTLVGADADLRDVTPDVAGARWSVPVVTARLVLDGTRFLPGHVYRLELRRDRRALGSVLIYLYPPPAERVTRVNLDDRPEPASEGFMPAPVPKGRL